MGAVKFAGVTKNGPGVELDFDPRNIRVTLNSSMSVTYSLILQDLTNASTADATHDATIKVVTADWVHDKNRTGNLAPIARSNLGDGIFKDEYVNPADYAKRGMPLIGQGSYANNFWHIRPRVTYAKDTGVATRVTTYGAGNGKTYGDAFAGPEDFNNNKASVTGTPAVQWYEEHILRWEDQQLDGTVTTHGTVDFDYSGSAGTPAVLHYEHPKIRAHDTVMDHAVTYGGLVLEDAEQSWAQGIVAVPYAQTVAIPAEDKGKPVVMTVDGDTGTLLDFTASPGTLYIGTDGTAGNSFDNDPTSGGAFTITGGTGTGTQTGAATSVANLWWLPTRPNEESGTRVYLRDFGSHFGNPVDIGAYENFKKLDGESITINLTVCTAQGGVQVPSVSTISDCISTEDTVYLVGSTSDPVVAHIINGEDPSSRLMNSKFGARYGLDAAAEYVTVTGERSRLGGHNEGGHPLSNYTLTDFSRVCAGARGRAFRITPNAFTATHTDFLVEKGFIGEFGSGFYPTAQGGSNFTLENVTMRQVVGRNLGITNYADTDAHMFGFQGASKNLTLEYFICIDCGGPVQFYQAGGWLTNSVEHQWGDIRVRYGHVDGTPAGFNTASSNNVGVHFGGDNDDDAQNGSGAANPPTDATSFDAEVTAVRVLNKGESFRSKWRDRPVRFRNCYSDSSLRAEYEIAGQDPGDSRAGQLDMDGCATGGNHASQVIDINLASGYQIIANNNTYIAGAAETVFDGDTFTNWQARVRSGDTYDPNSTRNDP